jgi:acyl-CoA synthetase (AMP-forming)/AMP-acid ligase II
VLGDLLAGPAAAVPEKAAVVEPSRSATFAQLDRAAGVLARRLREAGLAPGAVIAIQAPTTADYTAALLAVWRIGAVALPLDPALGPAEVTSYVARTRAAAVLSPGRSLFVPFEALLNAPPADEEGIPLPAVRGEGGRRPGEGRLAAPPPHPGPLPPENGGRGSVADAPALLLLSSGTTGLPKFVVRTAAQTLAAVGLLATALPLTDDDRVLCLLPPFHSAGLFNGLLATLRRGATIYFDTFSPRQTLAMIEQRRITVLLGVPLVYRLLAELPPPSSPPPDLASLRLACSSTAALSRGIVQRFEERFGVAITQTYGSTESQIIAATRPGQRVDPPNLVGPPLPSVTVSIRDDAGRPAAEGTLWVRSPGAAAAYLGDPFSSAETFRQGWVVTGDIARLDEAGNLLLLGRRRPLISIAGRKVAPAEVEACLRSHPAVADVVVQAGGGPGGGECIEAKVVKAAEVTAAELRDYCGLRLADFKVPRRIEFVANLSRGPLGKTL